MMSEKLKHDERVMFGKYLGEKFCDVPDSYLIWFLKQSWCEKYPDLVKYAENVIEDIDE